MTDRFYFCHNPRCRFHIEISAAQAALGEIEVEKLEKAGCMDAFDAPAEVSGEGRVTKRRFELCYEYSGLAGPVYLCEDCHNAAEFALDKMQA